ncbi:IclR family transcriptional regulator [Saccharopolyspora hattusasensis]|uniref:IclR family transcriptional regulator n=1 Tax=Saccharopolyspora hattusasensis TaxID=1128679 RepID=UPI003D966E27
MTIKQASSQMISKISALLETLGAHDELNATELSELLGEPRSSVYRMLRSLADIGWVDEGTAKGSWRLGLQLFRLSSGAVQRMDVRRIARPHMERLNKLTEQTVFLCIRHEWSAVCIERIEGLRVASLELQLGGSLPLQVGAAPQSLLAYADQDVLDGWQVLAEQAELTGYTQESPRTAAEVLPKLDEIRRVGYSLSDGDVTPGVGAIGAPLYDHSGEVRAALSVCGLRDFIFPSDSSVLRETLATARAISRSLGAPPALLGPEVQDS